MQGFQGVLANEMYEVFAKTVDLGSLDAPDMQALAELVLADPPERQYGVEAGVVRVPRFHALDTCVSFFCSLGGIYVASVGRWREENHNFIVLMVSTLHPTTRQQDGRPRAAGGGGQQGVHFLR